MSGARHAHLLARYAGAGPRYTSYPPVPAWSGDVTPAVRREALAGCTGPFGLYVHIPFCAERCWYCGCNVQIQPTREPADRYLDALAEEVGALAQALPGGRRVSALHLGGGTPNYLTRPQLERLHDLLAPLGVGGDTVRSIELDPRCANVEQMSWLAGQGYQRMSFGVQDLNPDVGAAIGRPMDFHRLARLLDAARVFGATSVNFDVMYGLPRQTPESFRATLEGLAAIRPDRLAVFGYAHVPWMRPQQRRLERSGPLPDVALRFELFQLAVEVLEGCGYEWVGLDHFALSRDPLAVAARDGTLRRSFQGYTPGTPRTMLGLGASAIGYLAPHDAAALYVQNLSAVKAYERGAAHLPIGRSHRLSPQDYFRGGIIESLLCYGRVDRAELWERLPAVRDALRPMEDDGLVELRPDGLTVTRTGRFFIRSIALPFDHTSASFAGTGPRRSGRYSATI